MLAPSAHSENRRYVKALALPSRRPCRWSQTRVGRLLLVPECQARPDPVGAENLVRPAQATSRYSWTSPPRRSLLRSLAGLMSSIVPEASWERTANAG